VASLQFAESESLGIVMSTTIVGCRGERPNRACVAIAVVGLATVGREKQSSATALLGARITPASRLLRQ
jgi:hypothetical protein